MNRDHLNGAGQRTAFALAFLLIPVACHSAKSRQDRAQSPVASTLGEQRPPAPSVKQSVYPTHGKLVSLQVQADQLAFCDAAGSFSVDLAAGNLQPSTAPCARRKLEMACPATPPVIETRHPYNGAQDIIDTVNNEFPLAGDVRDCAVDGSVIAVTTSSGVRLLNDSTGQNTVLSTVDGDYVGMDQHWVAWSSAGGIHTMSRAGLH